jgi:hypothetical protein
MTEVHHLHLASRAAGVGYVGLLAESAVACRARHGHVVQVYFDPAAVS